jgi:hypothetical protein
LDLRLKVFKLNLDGLTGSIGDVLQKIRAVAARTAKQHKRREGKNEGKDNKPKGFSFHMIFYVFIAIYTLFFHFSI